MPGVPTFFLWFHRLLFTSSYIRFNKAEFPQAIDGSINKAKRQRKTVGASAAVDLSSVAKKHCPNSHAGPEYACKNSGFYELQWEISPNYSLKYDVKNLWMYLKQKIAETPES